MFEYNHYCLGIWINAQIYRVRTTMRKYFVHGMCHYSLQLNLFSLFAARDRKHNSMSVGSEIGDEEGKSSQDNDLEKMTVPKPKGGKKGDGDSDSDDDAFDDRSV